MSRIAPRKIVAPSRRPQPAAPVPLRKPGQPSTSRLGTNAKGNEDGYLYVAGVKDASKRVSEFRVSVSTFSSYWFSRFCSSFPLHSFALHLILSLVQVPSSRVPFAPFPPFFRPRLSLTLRSAPRQTEADTCPICHTDRQFNKNLRLLVSPCYHKMCESCIDRLFTLGPEPCPQCGRILRKANFAHQTFEDLRVEKEVAVRRRMAEQSVVLLPSASKQLDRPAAKVRLRLMEGKALIRGGMILGRIGSMMIT